MRKVIQKRVRRRGGGVNLVADVNAVVATNVDRKDGASGVTSRQSVTIVQRNGHTEVTEEHSES